jgi:hypothetical protein
MSQQDDTFHTHDTLTSVQRLLLHASYHDALAALGALLQERNLPPQISEAGSFTLLSLPAHQDAPALLLYTPYAHTSTEPQQLRAIAVTLAALDACRSASPTDALPVRLLWLLSPPYAQTDYFAPPGQLLPHSPLLGCLWDASGDTGLDDNIPHIALGCKGVLRVDLRTCTGLPVRLRHSAIVPNALWRLVDIVHSIRDSSEAVHLPGFYESIQPLPDEELASLYLLPDTSAALAKQWHMPRLLLDLQGLQQHYAHLLTPTCVLTLLQETATLDGHIPTCAHAVLDFYLVPGQQPETVFAALQQHLHVHGFGDTITLQLITHPPVHTLLANPFAQRVQQAGRRSYGEDLHVLPLTAGWLPVTTLTEGAMDIPCIITTLGAAPYFAQSVQLLIHLLGGDIDATDTAQ